MRKIFVLMIIAAMASATAMAQPKKSRVQTQNKTAATTQKKGSSTRLTQRARMEFPVAETMPEEVVWRRDIYRELDLTQNENAGLYYPVEPQGKQMNLFTYIFKLALAGYVPVYEYSIDGNESFEASARLKFKSFLDNYHVFYETKDGKIRVDNSDIPSPEVKAYYIKESSYFDQSASEFHTQVLALCPIMMRQDDFGDTEAKYPLFWVKYSDLAPFLNRQTIMTSNLNNAATMSLDDYFTMNKYKGKIYKTNNMLGQTLAQYCPTDSAMAKEQRRIEAELKAFEQQMWGDQQKKDSLDSIAAASKDVKTKKTKKSRRSSSASKKSSGSNASSGSSAARVSVRRQRH